MKKDYSLSINWLNKYKDQNKVTQKYYMDKIKEFYQKKNSSIKQNKTLYKISIKDALGNNVKVNDIIFCGIHGFLVYRGIAIYSDSNLVKVKTSFIDHNDNLLNLNIDGIFNSLPNKRNQNYLYYRNNNDLKIDQEIIKDLSANKNITITSNSITKLENPLYHLDIEAVRRCLMAIDYLKNNKEKGE